jgi:hypothetical protein
VAEEEAREPTTGTVVTLLVVHSKIALFGVQHLHLFRAKYTKLKALSGYKILSVYLVAEI